MRSRSLIFSTAMTGESGKVYILFTNVRVINYANIIFSPTLLSQHLSVELSVYLIQSVNIVNYLILYFLNYLDWSIHFYSGRTAGGLAENQDEKYNFLSDFHNLLLTTLKHHINLQLKKCFKIIPEFLHFCHSKTSTITTID